MSHAYGAQPQYTSAHGYGAMASMALNAYPSTAYGLPGSQPGQTPQPNPSGSFFAAQSQTPQQQAVTPQSHLQAMEVYAQEQLEYARKMEEYHRQLAAYQLATQAQAQGAGAPLATDSSSGGLQAYGAAGQAQQMTPQQLAQYSQYAAGAYGYNAQGFY